MIVHTVTNLLQSEAQKTILVFVQDFSWNLYKRREWHFVLP